MDPLKLADRLREDYRRFTWTTYPIADPLLRERLERMADEDSLLWHGPFLSVQPRFELATTLAELGDHIGLPTEVCAAFPRIERLFSHQASAITRINAGLNTLVATGTGSGKTEAFLIPVVAHAYANRHRRGVKAIALYPMNALVNDQEDRVKAACEQLGLRYGVYTGATPQNLRDAMQDSPPDILLTNYSMLEYLLTRRDDRKLFGDGVLRHLILDEVHTYQGALGTEIACLVRRLRGHIVVDGLVCVGLSATVSAGGDHAADLERTAEFAANLFGAPFDVGAIVEEIPIAPTAPDIGRIGPSPDADALAAALADGADLIALRAVLGDPNDSPMLDLLRAKLSEPRTITELVAELAEIPARATTDPAQLHDEVAGWLLLGAGTSTLEGPPVLEAKVHLFLRGLPHLVRCCGEGEHLLLDGAEVCPEAGCDAQATTPLGVCLGCGQDFDLEIDNRGGHPNSYVVRRTAFDPVEQPLPRTRWFTSRRCVRCGSSTTGLSCHGCGAPTRSVFVCEPEPDKPLTRCPVCGYGRNVGAVQEFTARTASAIAATAFSLHLGLAEQSDDVMLRRLLVFADSRQDTAFQAGYIRGRSRAVQVRRLITRAVRARVTQGRPTASFDGLVEDVFRMGRDIGLYGDPAGRDASNRVRRVCEWDVLGEVASDERRPPTLERLGMITVGYPGLDELTPQDLSSLTESLGSDLNSLRWLLGRILDLVRTRGGVAHELLRARMEPSAQYDLVEAGAIMRPSSSVVGLGETSAKVKGAVPISLGARGTVARLVRIAFPHLINADDQERTVRVLVAFLRQHNLLDRTQVGTGRSQVVLWQLAPQAMEIRPPATSLYQCRACRAVQPQSSPRNICATFNCKGVMEPWQHNPDDYERKLAEGHDPLAVTAEEHSGQIPLTQREDIEERFKNGELNLLVCTMTLELGVDLGQLLAVVLRNVPPRPSNYAQRAGRAGRREERVALIVTYAGGMPHDSYYYRRPVEMIRGAIRPPTFLMDNERVITRHARALALELCGENLPNWMGDFVSEDDAGELQDLQPVRDALTADTDRIAERIHATFRHGLREEDLPWLDADWAHGIVTTWLENLDEAVGPYRLRQKTLLEEWSQAAATPGKSDSTRALQTISASLMAMRRSDRTRAYVLSYLSTVGFLPSYAFPTDTATLSMEGETAELSQDSIQAVKDYAPGQLVYARGAKWLVDQVDFRRSNLVNSDGHGAVPQANLCPRCDTINDSTSASCLSCDNVDLLTLVTVPMRAMRASRRQRIGADEENRSRQPFEVTHHLGAPNTAETWLFERPGLVLQWERNAALTVLNRGRVQHGAHPEQFAICTSCGLCFDSIPGPNPTESQRRRAKLHDTICASHRYELSVLSTARGVDCLHVLPDLEALDIRASQLEEFLASVRAALDLGCRVVLQAGEDEVAGFDWPRPDPDSAEALLRLAVLYEEVPGGAGYLRQLAERFGEVATALVPVLDGCTCERACYACLRSYNNQLEGHLLNRHVAADFLRQFINAPAAVVHRVGSFADGFHGLPRSPIERRLALALIEAQAPRGHAQYAWGDRGSTDGTPRPVTIADFAWPEHKVAVFCDGWQHHHTPQQQAEDKTKRDAMRASGWTVLAFWGGQIVRDISTCVVAIMQVLNTHPIQPPARNSIVPSTVRLTDNG
ncbi:DEAD/DEAH box helicase [Nocardia gipuzkoensis]